MQLIFYSNSVSAQQISKHMANIASNNVSQVPFKKRKFWIKHFRCKSESSSSSGHIDRVATLGLVVSHLIEFVHVPPHYQYSKARCRVPGSKFLASLKVLFQKLKLFPLYTFDTLMSSRFAKMLLLMATPDSIFFPEKSF